MGVNRYSDLPPRQPNPWRKERTVTMKITELIVILAITFVIGWAVGQITAEGTAEDRTPTDRRETKVQMHRTNAQNYADWCGGYVQAEGDEFVVQGCDR